MCPYAQSLAIIIEVKPAILLEADRVELGIDSVFVTDHIKKKKTLLSKPSYRGSVVVYYNIIVFIVFNSYRLDMKTKILS